MPAPKDPEKYAKWKKKVAEKWTQEEEALLRENYPSHSLRELNKMLPRRSMATISEKARYMGLSRPEKPAPPPKKIDGPVSLWEKRCTACGEIKMVDEFPTEKKRGKAVYLAKCQACVAARHAAWRENQRAKALAGDETAKVQPLQRKTCTLCGEEKPITQFYKDKYRNDGYNHWCRDCKRNYDYDPETTLANKRYQRLTRPPVSPEVKKRYRLQKEYGMTVEQYMAMLESQGGVCASCGNPETAIDAHTKQVREFLAVDHDHETGKVRALLCNNCNVALGFLQDDPVRIEALLNYIKTHRDILPPSSEIA